MIIRRDGGHHECVAWHSSATGCLIPADGWYEWRRNDSGTGKQAYFMIIRMVS